MLKYGTCFKWHDYWKKCSCPKCSQHKIHFLNFPNSWFLQVQKFKTKTLLKFQGQNLHWKCKCIHEFNEVIVAYFRRDCLLDAAFFWLDGYWILNKLVIFKIPKGHLLFSLRMKILKDSFSKKESKAKTAVFPKTLLARLIFSTFQYSNCLGCII